MSLGGLSIARAATPIRLDRSDHWRISSVENRSRRYFNSSLRSAAFGDDGS